MTLLSHYTTRAGLEGIARSKTLWATNFMDVNDKTELVYGLSGLTKRALISAWDEIQKHMRPEDRGIILDEDDFTKKLVAHYRETFEGISASEHLFVTSFARS